MYIDRAPVDEGLLIIEFWVKISVNSSKSVMIRPFSWGLSIFTISLKCFAIYERKGLSGWVSGKVLTFH